MKIIARDIFGGDDVTLTAILTTDHPASSYGQLVMMIDEWDGDCMSHQNWILAGCQVVEIAEEEIEDFKKWHHLIEVLVGGLAEQANYLTASELAEKSGVGHSRIRQLAADIPGGKKTDRGWMFPSSAVEYVKSLPGRGRPPKKV